MAADTASRRSWRDRSLYVALASLALVVLVQSTLLPRIRLLGAQPDLLLVLVVCWSLFYGVSDALLLAFFGGLALDVVAGLPLGTTSLALMPVCFLGLIGRRSLYVNNIWLPVLLVALATLIEGVLMLFMRQVRGVPVEWAGAASQIILPALLLNVLLTFVVARLMRGGTDRAESPAAA